MWAEARKHEKKLRGLMVDYRRRAERRREFYDRIRSDPAAFLQIHGMQLKVHIDPNICSMAESSLMPWMGDNNNMIDRFDVRAHLDQLDQIIAKHDVVTNSSNSNEAIDEVLERQINYERYRNLVQNEFLGLNESKFLQQIWFEERFGVNQSQKEVQNKVQKKKLTEKKATIAYNYDNEDSTSMTVQTKNSDSSESEESSDEDYDFDTTVNIDQLDNESGHRINGIALKFGLKNDDFVKYLDEDKTEAEKIRLQKELENEKLMFTGRKSRRERRALKEQRLLILRASNVEESDKLMTNKAETDKLSQSSSDSEDSVDESKIEFITSFGGSSEDETRRELEEKKRKEVFAKRKQKIKSLLNEKIEPMVMFGPTLPGEDSVLSMSNTSFNKSSHSKGRSYRFTDSVKRSRSRSRSNDKNKYRRTGHRFSSRRNRGRTRSPEVRRSTNRTPDRYRERDRSRSRDRIRRRSRTRSRSRKRSRSWSRNRNQTRRRSRSRRRTRSSSRSRRAVRRRTRSRDRKNRSRSRRRSRSRIRSRSRNRNKDREQRSSRKKSPQKSRSISRDKKELQIEIKSDISAKSVPSVPQTEEPIVCENMTQSPKNDEKNEDIDLKMKSESNSLSLESQPIVETESVKEEKPSKVPSPPVKSYYRHDLCDSEGSDEELALNDRPKLESDEGTRKRTNNTSNTCNTSYTQSGYKSSSAVTPHERLKKKRQTMIDRQYKLDKKAELQKIEKQQQEKEDREEELREMTSKLRYRRDVYRERRNSRSSSRSKSTSKSRSSSSSSY